MLELTVLYCLAVLNISDELVEIVYVPVVVRGTGVRCRTAVLIFFCSQTVNTSPFILVRKK